MAECWSCGAERGEAAFCGTCGVVQPVSDRLDYFQALGLAPTMRLERSAIDRAFREASKRVHPDRFPRDEPAQRKMALAHTERVNEAYRALKEPRSRAEYMLSLRGMAVAEETERTQDTAFLMQMLEKQEEVQNADNEAQVLTLKEETKARYDALLTVVTEFFDDGVGRLEDTRAALAELRYLHRMLKQIALKEEELLL